MTTSSRDNHAIATLERIKTIYATPKSSYASTEVRRKLPAPLLQHKLDSLDESPFDLEAPANEALLPKLSSTSPMDPTSVLKPSRGKGAFDPLLRSMSSSQNWSSHSTCRASLTSSPVLQTQNIEPSTPHHHNILLRHSFHGKKASWESYVYEVTTADYAKLIATEAATMTYL